MISQKRPAFTKEMETRLLKMMSEHPFLYNRADKFYFDRCLKEKTWRDFANKFNVHVSSVKRRWGYLREQYIKHLRAEAIEGPEYNGWKHRFPHYENMHFFKRVYRPLKNDFKMPWDDEEYDDCEDIYYKYYSDTLAKPAGNLTPTPKAHSSNRIANKFSGDHVEDANDDFGEEYLQSTDCTGIALKQTVQTGDSITFFLKHLEGHLRSANFSQVELLKLQSKIFKIMITYLDK